jgi:hypothetical protein
MRNQQKYARMAAFSSTKMSQAIGEINHSQISIDKRLSRMEQRLTQVVVILFFKSEVSKHTADNER